MSFTDVLCSHQPIINLIWCHGPSQWFHRVTTLYGPTAAEVFGMGPGAPSMTIWCQIAASIQHWQHLSFTTYCDIIFLPLVQVLWYHQQWCFTWEENSKGKYREMYTDTSIQILCSKYVYEYLPSKLTASCPFPIEHHVLKQTQWHSSMSHAAHHMSSPSTEFQPHHWQHMGLAVHLAKWI